MTEDPTAEPQENSSGLTAFLGPLILFGTFAFFYASPVSQIIDTRGSSIFSYTLLHEGKLSVPATPANKKDYRFIRAGGRARYYFSEAPLVLNAPFVLGFELAGVSVVDASGNVSRRGEALLFRFVAALLAAATCWIFWNTATEYLTATLAALLTLGFAIASPVASTLARPFWSHSWAAFLLSAAIFLLMAERFAERRWAHVAMGMLAAWAYFCRPSMSLGVIALVVLLLIQRRRQVGWFMVGSLGWLALFVVHSLTVFGTALPRYFRSPGQGFAIDGNFLEALAGTMVSPGRGLLVYLPYLGVLAFLAVVGWREIPRRSIVVAAGGVLVLHWIVVASFHNWWGGHSFGPRLFADTLPWLFAAAVLILRGTRDRGHAGHAPRVAIAVLIASFVLGTFIHGRGAMDAVTLKWHEPIPEVGLPRVRRLRLFRQERLWNWRYPQFLSGMVKPPPLDIPEEWLEDLRSKRRKGKKAEPTEGAEPQL